MKYAKSMYRAGFIVDAEDCDYDSAKDLGLVCPFCSEALFLRRGHLRGKSSYVEAAFCHYHTDDPMADVCELRAQRPEGQAYIAKVDAESRQQRLEIYNKRLTDLIFDTPGKAVYKFFRKTSLDQKDWEGAVKSFRTYLRKNVEHSYAVLDKELDSIQYLVSGTSKAAELKDLLQEGVRDAREMKAVKDTIAFYSSLDLKIQRTICQEILDFLTTRTAGYTLLDLLSSAASRIVTEELKKNTRQSPETLVKNVLRQSEKLLRYLAIQLIQVDWPKVLLSTPLPNLENKQKVKTGKGFKTI